MWIIHWLFKSEVPHSLKSHKFNSNLFLSISGLFSGLSKIYLSLNPKTFILGRRWGVLATVFSNEKPSKPASAALEASSGVNSTIFSFPGHLGGKFGLSPSLFSIFSFKRYLYKLRVQKLRHGFFLLYKSFARLLSYVIMGLLQQWQTLVTLY